LGENWHDIEPIKTRTVRLEHDPMKGRLLWSDHQRQNC